MRTGRSRIRVAENAGAGVTLVVNPVAFTLPVVVTWIGYGVGVDGSGLVCKMRM